MLCLIRKILALVILALALSSCLSPGQISPITHYQLTPTINQQPLTTQPIPPTLLISVPSAVPVYQSNNMIYRTKKYKLDSFAHSDWDTAPANMVASLLTQSLQNTGFFYAVVPAPSFAQSDWRIDTQLTQLVQDFTQTPSRVDMEIDVTLIDNRLFKIIANHRFFASAIAPEDTPYGGVIAANVACQQLLQEISVWAVKEGRLYYKK